MYTAKIKVLDYNHTKHDVKCGIHSGFPICCVLFYSFVLNPMKMSEIPPRIVKLNEKDGAWCQPLTIRLEEKSIRGLTSLILENLRSVYYSYSSSFLRGQYFRCPICIARGKVIQKFNSCKCYEKSGIKADNKEMSPMIVEIVRGFVERKKLSKNQYKTNNSVRTPASASNLLKLFTITIKETWRYEHERRDRLGQNV